MVANLSTTIKHIYRDADLRAIAVANAMLQFFYHLAPLYIPLYLHSVLGIPWSTLGWVFAIMLLPYVLLEYPAGWLADRMLGDRKMLMFGFGLIGMTYSSVALIGASTPILTITLLLVATRVGGALCEAMIEGHFFRRVTERDANTVSVFRMMRPVSALAAPLVGSVLLLSGYYTLFVVTGLFIFGVGVFAAHRIEDLKREKETEMQKEPAGVIAGAV